MRAIFKPLLLSAAAVLLIGVCAQGANADGGPVFGYCGDQPTCTTVGIGDQAGGQPGAQPVGTGSTGTSTCDRPTGAGVPTDLDCTGCHWVVVPAVSLTPAQLQEILAHPGGSLEQHQCWSAGPPAALIVGGGVAYFPPGTPTPINGIPAASLAAQATFTLPTPQIGSSPASNAYVNVPTYLYVLPASWAPIVKTVTDTVKTVTVTATPYELDWDTGDTGSPDRTVVCTSPGRPYQPAVDGADVPLAQLHPPCGYTYQSDSSQGPELVAGDPQTKADKLTAQVDYHLTWTCAGPCDQARGTRLDLQATGTSWRVVYQLEAINCVGEACYSQPDSTPPTAPAA